MLAELAGVGREKINNMEQLTMEIIFIGQAITGLIMGFIIGYLLAEDRYGK